MNPRNRYGDWAFELCVWVACVNTNQNLALDSKATTSLINENDNSKLEGILPGKGAHVKI